MSSPLVASNDSYLAGWQAGDQATFLSMVCAEVQKFCGWHIAPSMTITNKTCWVGGHGLVMLGSTHVTEIDQVTVNGQTLTAGSDYTWDEPKGWFRLHPTWLQIPYWPTGGELSASVNFVSGYPSTPLDVRAVIFELLATAMELPASNADELTTMQYSFKLNPTIGVTLSQNQQERLGAYRLRSFGGRVRP